jgi:hypothetical protein
MELAVDSWGMAKKPEPPKPLEQPRAWVCYRAGRKPSTKQNGALAKRAAPAPCAGYEGAGTLRTGPGEGGNPHARSAWQEAGPQALEVAGVAGRG